MKNILFRADSSFTIGTGHIMRDLVLAKQYPNANITFATQKLGGNINHKIVEAGYKIEILNSNDLQELDKLIKKLDIDIIVIDHYGIDENQEKQLKIKNPTVKIMVLDDTYEKHHCDILLNHNISSDSKRYKNLVPKGCELRCGAKYTLLRDEFKKQKRKYRRKNLKYRVFVAMGGADHKSLNIKILKVLLIFKDIQIDVVSTYANANLQALRSFCKSKKNINLHINSNQIAKLMHRADLAIVTPSVTVNEVYFLQTDFIAIKTANNQDDIYRYLKQKRFDVMDRFKRYKLYTKVRRKCKI